LGYAATLAKHGRELFEEAARKGGRNRPQLPREHYVKAGKAGGLKSARNYEDMKRELERLRGERDEPSPS